MIIYPGLISSDFFIMKESDGSHSFRIWLWETQEDLKRYAERYAAGPKYPGKYDNVIGLFNPSCCNIHEPFSHLGEVHFVKGLWDEEKVAHELDHLQFQYIRKCIEDFVRPLYQYYQDWMEWEEEICYPFGQWFAFVWRWLWKKNPNPKWVKEKVDVLQDAQ